MYHKEPRWSQTPVDVYRKVGSPSLPSRPLIEYVLSHEAIHTLIIGIGQIDEDPLKCQLVQNYYASQVGPNSMNEIEKTKIEQITGKVKDGRTNWLQIDKVGLTAPRAITTEAKGSKTKITWQTAYADEYPISHYEVFDGSKKLGEIKHNPQLLKSKPFAFEAKLKGSENVSVYTVDKAGQRVQGKIV
jgi:hypothetical protein